MKIPGLLLPWMIPRSFRPANRFRAEMDSSVPSQGLVTNPQVPRGAIGGRQHACSLPQFNDPAAQPRQLERLAALEIVVHG